MAERENRMKSRPNQNLNEAVAKDQLLTPPEIKPWPFRSLVKRITTKLHRRVAGRRILNTVICCKHWGLRLRHSDLSWVWVQWRENPCRWKYYHNFGLIVDGNKGTFDSNTKKGFETLFFSGKYILAATGWY